jgi:hypothetical protein
MSAHKIPKPKPKSELGPLPPEAEAALSELVDRVASACEADRDPEIIRKLVITNPDDPLWDLHLMAALGNIRHAAIPPLLASLFGASPDKARRKALKRTLHLLKTRGVPVPEELLPREEPEFGKPRPAGVKSRVSPILGNGDCYLVLEGPKEVLGGNFLVARLSDVLGLQECHLLSQKSPQVAELWEHYRRHGLTEWFPVPGPYAVRLLEEAYAAKTAIPAAKNTYSSLRDQVWKNWGRPEEAPDLEQVLPALEPAEANRLLEQSRQLAGLPLFQTWMPALEELSPWIDKVKEVQESPLVLSDSQKQTRLNVLIDEATQALYPAAPRPLWHRRLLAMAYYLDLSNRPTEARLAQAAAADLAEAQRSAIAGENPFLKGLVQMGLHLAWELQQKSQEAQSPSGLLTLPGDPRRLGS